MKRGTGRTCYSKDSTGQCLPPFLELFSFPLVGVGSRHCTFLEYWQVLNRSFGISLVCRTRFCEAFVSCVKHDRKFFEYGGYA